MAMKELEWAIGTPDGAKIHGVTSLAGEKPAEKAVVMVHGLTGWIADHPAPLAVLHFLKNGYDVIRFNLYSALPGGRCILDCTLQTHVADLNTVLEQKAGAYRKRFLTGHSYGGPTIMIANPEGVAAVSLWDPSYDLAKMWAGEDAPTPYGEHYVLRWGVVPLIGKNMIEQDRRITREDCRALARAAHFPVQVIHAGKGILHAYGESWHSHCPQPTDYLLIEQAGHSFEQLETVPVLLDRCTAWFARFCS